MSPPTEWYQARLSDDRWLTSPRRVGRNGGPARPRRAERWGHIRLATATLYHLQPGVLGRLGVEMERSSLGGCDVRRRPSSRRRGHASRRPLLLLLLLLFCSCGRSVPPPGFIRMVTLTQRASRFFSPPPPLFFGRLRGRPHPHTAPSPHRHRSDHSHGRMLRAAVRCQRWMGGKMSVQLSRRILYCFCGVKRTHRFRSGE